MTSLRLVATATSEKGTTGAGTVTFETDLGTIEPTDPVALDTYGTARAAIKCDVIAEPRCADGATVTARWNESRVTASSRLRFDAAATTSPSPTQQTVTMVSDGTWRITGSAPTGDWTSSPTYDVSAWALATVVGPPHPDLDAPSIWDGPTATSGSQRVYARKVMTLAGTRVVQATLGVALNDDGEVWVNGTSVFRDADGVVTINKSIEVGAFLRSGENVIAVTCNDVVGPEHVIRLLVRARVE